MSDPAQKDIKNGAKKEAKKRAKKTPKKRAKKRKKKRKKNAKKRTILPAYPSATHGTMRCNSPGVFFRGKKRAFFRGKKRTFFRAKKRSFFRAKSAKKREPSAKKSASFAPLWRRLRRRESQARIRRVGVRDGDAIPRPPRPPTRRADE